MFVTALFNETIPEDVNLTCPAILQQSSEAEMRAMVDSDMLSAHIKMSCNGGGDKRQSLETHC
jgi:hypothetical protein